MRKRLMVGALSVLLASAATSQVVTTDAAWQTSEWTHSAVGASDCTETGVARTRGNGRLLSGGLLGLDLDSVAEVRGMVVTNDATTAHPTPTAATAGANNAWRNPLDVGVLSAINLPLSATTLDEILEIPLATDVGVLNQWAQANSTGQSAGAAGVVNDSGVVMTNSDFGGGTPPDLGTLKLSRLVSQVTGQAVGDVVAGLSDLDLEIGAVAGRAQVNTCQQAWGASNALQRQYAIAGLDLLVASPLVGQLVTTVNAALSGTQTLVNNLASNTGLLSQITSGVSGLLTGTLDAFDLGAVTLTGPTAVVNFGAVQTLLSQPIADPGGLLKVDLGDGVVRIDLAALAGEAYSGTGFAGTGPGLNGLAPNTELVLNSSVVNALTGALTDALDEWVDDVVAAAEQAVLAATVSFSLNLKLKVGLLDVVDATVSANNVALSSLMAGTATLSVTANSLLGPCTNPVTTPLPCLVNPLVGAVVTALTGGVGPIVGNAIHAVLLSPTSPIRTLGANLQLVTAPLVTLVGEVLNVYLGVNGLVSLRANVQNDPIPATSASYPEWENPPQEVPTGRFDVAALGVVVLGATGTSPSVNLELARGSVGVNCGLGSAAQAAGRCAGY